MKVYGIGGLGVDERVFSELELDFELMPLQWIEPKPNESIQSYANRFARQIDSNGAFSIIGISFGGMLAIELSKIIDPHKIVLISSATSKSDIPLIYRIYGRAGLFNVTPDSLMKPAPFMANWFFGVSEPRYQDVLKQVIADTDIDFLRWASNEIARWDNRHLPMNMIRIHGSSDRLLKYPKNENVRVISKAGHFMIMNRAKQLSEVLNQELKHEG